MAERIRPGKPAESSGTKDWMQLFDEHNAKQAEAVDPDNYVLPVGKYKGHAIADVPTGYLRWCYDNFENTHESYTYIERELEKRENEKAKH